MGDTVEFYKTNIFAEGTVTESGTPDSSKPVYRLYDGFESLYWGQSGTGVNIDIEVDQSGLSSAYDCDLVVLANHNMTGATGCVIQYSDDGSSWTDLSGWTSPPTSSFAYLRTSTLSHNYWRLHIVGADDPVASELFVGPKLEITAKATPVPRGDIRNNVMWKKTVGGSEISVKLGDKRKILSYSADLTVVESDALFDFAGDYDTPFYFYDLQGDLFLARFNDVIKWEYNSIGSRRIVEFSIIEMLS